MLWFRSTMSRTLPALALAGMAALAAPALAQDAESITEDGVIKGTMDIEFLTRTNLDTSGDLKEGSAAIGTADTYKLTIDVAKTTQFSGTVKRQPNLYSKMLQRRKQDALLTYSVDLSLFNPKDLKQKKTVGKWVGTVPIDTTSGHYDLAGGKAKESPLRVQIDTVGKASGFVDYFGGKMIGKAEKKEGLAGYTYKRLVGKKTVTYIAKKVDPMTFLDIDLAKGPAETYPRARVSGRLDYDYETGNYFTERVTFRYALNGKDVEDVMSGSIKWVKEPDYDTSGKSYYEFNLRFNEEKFKAPTTEGDAFAGMSDEEAFFAVDTSVPSLTGRISYVDTMISGSELPSASKVTYSLNANKLTKPQTMNFFKLWLICVGPTNDE
jgi:hypothetical protein